MQTKQKQQLKAKAHKLKPVVMVGGNGLTESVIKEVDRALTDHELIKIKIAGSDRNERKQVADSIAAELNAVLLQSIGNIVVLYRKNEESE